MAVGLGAWMGQVAGPVFVKACRRLRRWYKRTSQKPRVLHVADLAAEAPGSCSVCLGELADDDNEGVLRGGGAGTGGASAGGAPAAPAMTVLVPPSAPARGAGSDDVSPRTAAAARVRPATAPEPCGRLPSPVELRRHVPRRLAQPTRPRPQPALPR